MKKKKKSAGMRGFVGNVALLGDRVQMPCNSRIIGFGGFQVEQLEDRAQALCTSIDICRRCSALQQECYDCKFVQSGAIAAVRTPAVTLRLTRC